MDALDGNAIAGDLLEYFSADMTTARGRCETCGAHARIAELRVYSRAPGTVVRCRSCGNVVIVLVKIRNSLEIDTSGFNLLDLPPDAAPTG